MVSDKYEGQLTVSAPNSNLDFFISKTTSDPGLDDHDYRFTKPHFKIRINHGTFDSKSTYMKILSYGNFFSLILTRKFEI